MLYEPSARQSCRVLAALDGAHRAALEFVNALPVRVVERDVHRVVVDLLLVDDVLFAHDVG